MIRFSRHIPRLFVCLALCVGVSLPAKAATKLAVLGTQDQRDATAVLIAGLSKNPDAYAILEREQLERVMAEPALQGQGLSLATATKAARLGPLRVCTNCFHGWPNAGPTWARSCRAESSKCWPLAVHWLPTRG